MAILERILSIGVTGSGKSFQWLKLARVLKPTGAKFRVLDTDNDIMYMLQTQFPELLPENGGNVYVHPAFDWPEYKEGVKWIQQRGLKPEELTRMDKHLVSAYKTPMKLNDWVVVDKANNAWQRVQDYFVQEVFGEDMGDYFLHVRKQLYERGDKSKSGKPATSIAREALDGWKDWSVINKLYDDWILPIIYKVHCHVYATSDVEKVERDEKDPEILSLFGDLKVKPAGQKRLGGQMHTIFLLLPGTENWYITTIKDRANRPYFKKVQLTSLYMQYLVAKAGWDIIDSE